MQQIGGRIYKTFQKISEPKTAHYAVLVFPQLAGLVIYTNN